VAPENATTIQLSSPVQEKLKKNHAIQNDKVPVMAVAHNKILA